MTKREFRNFVNSKKETLARGADSLDELINQCCGGDDMEEVEEHCITDIYEKLIQIMSQVTTTTIMPEMRQTINKPRKN